MSLATVNIETMDGRPSVVEVRQGPVGPTGPPTSNLPRAQISILSNTTATVITTINTYVQAGVVGVLDDATDIDFTALNTGKFGVKYVGTETKTFWIFALGELADGNNKMFAMRLAKNGTSIAASESQGHTGTAGAEAAIVTTWMVSLATNDEMSIMLANVSNTDDLTIKRARLVINCIP